MVEKADSGNETEEYDLGIADLKDGGMHALDERGIHDSRHGRYIGDVVYGALDGIVTTFAVISGVAGASLSSGVVMILGFANLFADGLSMAVGKLSGRQIKIRLSLA